MHSRLRFRRQFVLARTPVGELAQWPCIQVDRYHLYSHPDLPVTCASDRGRTLVLVGSIFDPEHPENDNAQILRTIAIGASDVGALFLQLKPLAGRYALLYADHANTVLLSDALGSREVYYWRGIDNRVVCGSQPNIVAEYADPQAEPQRDPEFLAYLRSNSAGSRWSPRSKWIGDETAFAAIGHLLPNHYLDIRRGGAGRYWPSTPIEPLTLETAADRACSFLQGCLRAMAHRHPLMLAVTAGIDSRTVLAASRSLQERIYYFVNDYRLGADHPDIRISSQMLRSVEVPFHVHYVDGSVDPEFAEVFLANTWFASERILPTIYNVYFKQLADRVNVIGLGEIGRTRYGPAPQNPTPYLLAYKLGHKADAYAVRTAADILRELRPVSETFKINLLTLLYWEHTLGNWGATGNSESDIAIEEINPFDSHLLYETLLGVDPRHARYDSPVLFKEMIGRMWPELLSWPVNPPAHNARDGAASLLKRLGVYPALRALKYQVSRAKFSVARR